MARIVVAKNNLPYPPNFGSDQVTFHLLRALATRHEVTLVVAVTEPDWAVHRQPLADMGISLVGVPMPNRRTSLHRVMYKFWYAICATVTRTPMDLWYYNFPAFRRAVATAATNADLVQFEYWYLYPTARSLAGRRRLLLKHDAEFTSNARAVHEAAPGPARLWARWRAWLRAPHERRACQHFERVACISDADAERVSAWCEPRPDVVFPVLPIAPADSLCHGFEECTLIYFGNIPRPANLQGLLRFVRSIYPAIKRAVPRARLVIRGGDPPPVLRAATADDDSIQFEAFGNDLDSRLRASTVAIVPLWVGSGIKIKVLTAAGLGLPVVTTPVGIEGIPAKSEEIAVAQDDEAFAAACVELLADSQSWRRQSAAVRAFAERELDATTRAPQIADTYEKWARRTHD